MSYKVKIKTIRLDLTVANQAYKISETPIRTSFFELHTVSNNSGSIYLADEEVNSTDNIPRAANTTTAFSASTRGDLTSGDYWDLSDLYLLAASGGDDVIIQYHVPAKSVKG